MLFMKDAGKTKVKIEMPPVGGDTAPHLLTYLGCHLMIKLCLFSLLESFFLSLCCFSAMHTPNGLRLTAFSKPVQYLEMKK